MNLVDWFTVWGFMRMVYQGSVLDTGLGWRTQRPGSIPGTPTPTTFMVVRFTKFTIDP